MVNSGATISGSLVDDGDDVGEPPASIGQVAAPSGPGPIAFGVATALDDTNGRPCGDITIAADGSYTFVAAPPPGPRECSVTYVLTNGSGSSAAAETFLVGAVP